MNKTNWLVERDGEEIARFGTLKKARQFLEIDGPVPVVRGLVSGFPSSLTSCRKPV